MFIEIIKSLFKSISILILAGIVILVGVFFYSYFIADTFRKPLFEAYEKPREWAEQFENIPLPPDSELIGEGYDVGNIGVGNAEVMHFGYYWLLKTELSEEELIAYYQPYIDEANIETIGNETILDYDNLSDSPYLSYYIDDSYDLARGLSKQERTENQYYIFYAFKRGRWTNQN